MATKYPLKPKIQVRLTVTAIILSIIAVLVGVFAIVTSSNARSNLPKKPDIQAEALAYSRVQNYAQNFFQVWVMGDDSNRATLNSFYSTKPLTDINADPARIDDLNVADLSVAPTDQGEILWTVTIGSTITPPGVTQSTRQYYEVDVIQKDESLTIAKLPTIVELNRPSIQAGDGYPMAVQTSSPLYQTAVNFAAAYLVPQNAETFGRYVTADFVGEPLKNSPYTGAQVTGVFAESGKSAEQYEPDETIHIRVRVRASTSQSTYQTMDLTLSAVKTECKRS